MQQLKHIIFQDLLNEPRKAKEESHQSEAFTEWPIRLALKRWQTCMFYIDIICLGTSKNWSYISANQMSDWDEV